MLADLTFVTKNSDGTLNLWTPERPDDYAEANRMGADYAAELLLMIERTGNPAIFGGVIRAMGLGVYGAVEAGFCTAVAADYIRLRGNSFTTIPRIDAA